MNDYPSPNGPPPKCSRIDENDENTDEKYFSSKNLDILDDSTACLRNSVDYETNDCDSGLQQNQAVLVLSVGGLNENISEFDLFNALSVLGPVSYVSFTERETPLVEFKDVSAAAECVVRDSLKPGLIVLKQPAKIPISRLKSVPRSSFESETPTNVLVIYVQNVKYPITTHVIAAICKPVKPAIRVKIIRETNNLLCLVEFENVEAARFVRQNLDGCDIYPGCCTLKVEYSMLSRLNVTKNDEDEADYVTPTSALAAPARVRRSPLLPDPPRCRSRRYEMITGYSDCYGLGGGTFQNSAGPNAYYDWHYSQESAVARNPALPPSHVGYDGNFDYRGGFDFQTKFLVANTVLIIHGLNMDIVSCDKIFNLFCQYGNVVRIKFFMLVSGVAVVQMGDNAMAQRVVENLNNCTVFGKRISVKFSNKTVLYHSKPYEMPDKTLSCKDYSSDPHNRFLTLELAAKNRINPPHKKLYFFNAPPHIIQQDLLNCMTDNCAPKPVKVKIFEKEENWKSSAGIYEFESVDEAVEAIMLCNHLILDDSYVLKLCFSGPPNISVTNDAQFIGCYSSTCHSSRGSNIDDDCWPSNHGVGERRYWY